MEQISYTITCQDLHLNYLEVEIDLASNLEETKFFLPNWTPGSYMIRNYSRHVHKFRVISPKNIQFIQNNLDEWSILNNGQNFKIRYTVYGFEKTVRTNFFSKEYVYIHPTATFLYPFDWIQKNIKIEIKINHSFKKVYTPLKKAKDCLTTNSFDELFDSPILLSNKKSVFFEAGKCKHEMIFEGNLSKEKIEEIILDTKKITQTQIDSMGISPNKRYLFINIFHENDYGGLEHLSSSVNRYDSNLLYDKDGYLKFLELLSHEYFHLWNIKRIRPIALGPFQYQVPNLTKELWIAEGATSYFDLYFLLETRIITHQYYLSQLNETILSVERSEGENWMSLEDSSFTAWTKYYYSSENPDFHNIGVSYYTKGSILVFCMDLYIRFFTENKIQFLDILKSIYQKITIPHNIGFTKDDFFKIAKELTGLDLYKEFHTYIELPKKIPIKKYLDLIGIERIQSNSTIFLGFDCKEIDQKLFISRIYKNNISKKSNVLLDDEWIAINSERITPKNREKVLKKFKPDQEVKLLLSRNGSIKEIPTTIEKRFFKNELVLKTDGLSEKVIEFQKNYFKLQ